MRGSIKKIGSWLALCCLPLMGWAQSPFSGKGVSFEAGFGFGYSSLGYKVAPTPELSPKVMGDGGYAAHIGVDFFFTRIFGLGIGADFSRYGGGIGLSNSVLHYPQITDTDGERYEHILNIYEWKERQKQLYVAPQVLFMWAVPFQKVSLDIEIGVEYAFCVGADYRAKGDLEHTGFYDKWGLTLHDVNSHGFYRTTDFKPSARLDGMTQRQQLSLVGRLGVLIPVASHWDLRLSVLAKYAVTGAPKAFQMLNGENYLGPTDSQKAGEAVGFYENNPPLQTGDLDPHYFMPAYQSLTTTELVKGHYAPLLVGLEIGIRYTLPFRKTEPCRCEDD